MGTAGIILLAAGGSRRLGRPKQLLPWGNTTLIRHMAGVALESGCGPVVVVLGCEAGGCASALLGMNLHVMVNGQWVTGMGGSISLGLKTLLLLQSDLEAVIIMLCDQPAVTVDVLRSLIHEQQKAGCAVVASRYSGTLGPPALFTGEMYPKLLRLKSGEGAKTIFSQTNDVSVVEFPEGSRDIDSQEDYLRILQESTSLP